MDKAQLVAWLCDADDPTAELARISFTLEEEVENDI